MNTSSYMQVVNVEWGLLGDVSSSFDESVEVDRGSTWECPGGVFT